MAEESTKITSTRPFETVLKQIEDALSQVGQASITEKGIINLNPESKYSNFLSTAHAINGSVRQIREGEYDVTISYNTKATIMCWMIGIIGGLIFLLPAAVFAVPFYLSKNKLRDDLRRALQQAQQPHPARKENAITPGSKNKGFMANLTEGAGAATKFVALQGERTKLKTLTLPAAYRSLGKDCLQQKRHLDCVVELTSQLRSVLDEIKQLAEVAPGLPVPQSFTDKAKAAGKYAVDVARQKQLGMRRDSLIGNVGKVIYEKHSDASGPIELVGPIASSIARIAQIDTEIGQQSQVVKGSMVKPKLGWLIPSKRKIVIGVGVAFAAFVLLAVVGLRISQEVKRQLSEGRQLWDEGKHDEASARFKAVIGEHPLSIPSFDRPIIFKHVIEHDSEKGNKASAKILIEQALAMNIPLDLTLPQAKEILIAVEAEKQRIREEAEEKERQAAKEQLAAKERLAALVEAAKKEKQVALDDAANKERQKALDKEAAKEQQAKMKATQDKVEKKDKQPAKEQIVDLPSGLTDRDGVRVGPYFSKKELHDIAGKFIQNEIRPGWELKRVIGILGKPTTFSRTDTFGGNNDAKERKQFLDDQLIPPGTKAQMLKKTEICTWSCSDDSGKNFIMLGFEEGRLGDDKFSVTLRLP